MLHQGWFIHNQHVVNMQKRGFTLIEMMVAVGLFVVVALISTSALIAMSAALRRSQNVRTVLDATSIAMDSMALRMTTKVRDIDFIIPGSSSIQFTHGRSPNTITYLYQLSGGRITLTKTPPDGSPSYLTPPTIRVDGLQFFVNNGVVDRATILIQTSGVADPTAKVDMQVTIVAQ